MGIKHNPELAARHVSKINGKLSSLKNSPKAENVSYSNLSGVTKGVTANNKILNVIHTYSSATKKFTDKINQVSKKFEAMDKNTQFGDDK